MCGVRVNLGAASIGINLESSRGSLSIVSVVTYPFQSLLIFVCTVPSTNPIVIL